MIRKKVVIDNDKYIGVMLNKCGTMYISHIMINFKNIILGYFYEKIEAAREYDKYVIDNKLGRKLNFPIRPDDIDDNSVWIQLSKNKWTLIDRDDYDIVSSFKWHAIKCGNKSEIWYASRDSRKLKNGESSLLHRLILGITDKSIHIDHINHNGLDNRKCNLRICTCPQNTRNALKKSTPSSSTFKGVSYKMEFGLYSARIRSNNKDTFLGYFKTAEEAAHVYDFWAAYFFQDFAHFNFNDNKFELNLNSLC
jgi:hypothetical protein